jgi:hypothetical protein
MTLILKAFFSIRAITEAQKKMHKNHFKDESGIIKEDPEIASLFGMTLILKMYFVV